MKIKNFKSFIIKEFNEQMKNRTYKGFGQQLISEETVSKAAKFLANLPPKN